MLQIAMFVLGLYALAESIQAADLMHKGDGLCIMAQQMAVGVAGGYAIILALKGECLPGDLIWAGAIALMLFPQMVHRIEKKAADIRRWFEDLDKFEAGE